MNPTKEINTTILMAVAMLTMFLNAFMGAALNIALPDISKEFALSAVEGSWVVMSFLLATAMFMVPFGKMADIYGRKKFFLWGNILFTLASLGCAASSNGFMLIMARFAQGIGGAMIMTTGMAILTAVFPPHVRGRMIGLAVSAVYLGLTAAPVLGGILTQSLGWKSIFLIGGTSGFIVITGIFIGLKAEWKEAHNERFDYLGSLIFMVSIFLLMYGFPKLPSQKGILLASSGLAGLIAFVMYEARLAAPILNIQLFKYNRTFAFSNLAALINYAATFAIGFVLSLYLQYAKGLSPREAGLILITQPLIMALTASLAGRLSDRIDPRLLASAGMAIIVVGIILLTFIDAETSNSLLITSLVIVGLGFGAFSSPNTNAVMSSVEKKFLGTAAATVSTMRVLGQIFSMAIAAMMFHIFLGNDKISQANIPAFLQSARIILIIFAVLCFLGIFASLARGKKQTENLSL